MAQLKDLIVSGAAKFLNGIDVIGDLTFAGNLLPAATGTYDLGSSSHHWRYGYINKLGINSGGSNMQDVSDALYVSGTTHLTDKLIADGNAYIKGVLGIGGENTSYKFYVNGATWISNDYLRIGNNASANYIAFYGTSGDNPGSFDHTYIGERLYGGSTESSELLLIKGNDASYDTNNAINVSGAGPDRIRHIAGGHLFQIYTSPLSGSFTDVGNSTAVSNILELTKRGANLTSIYTKSTGTSNVSQTVLGIYGGTHGNTAADMTSGIAGVFSYGDGGPQIDFKASKSADQAGALIFTDNDAAGTGVSWHFVSNQSDWNVNSKRFVAKSSVTIGYNVPQVGYALQVNGNSYFTGGNVTINGNLLPDKDKTYAIGSSTFRWNDIYANSLRLQGPSNIGDWNTTTTPRIEFTYDDSTNRLQPVYLGYTPTDGYRSPYGLKIWATDGTYPHAWLEVEGTIYARTRSESATTGAFSSPITTGTFLRGNQGGAIINSTANAGYTMLARMKSTNGAYTHGVFNGSYELYYTTDSIIAADTNDYTHGISLMNENGLTQLKNLVVDNNNHSNSTTSVGNGAVYIYKNIGGHDNLQSGQLVIGSTNATWNSGVGAGDVALELWRGGSASWQLINTGGILKFRNNWNNSNIQSFYSINSLWLNHSNGAGSIPSLAIGQTDFNDTYKLYVKGDQLSTGEIKGAYPNAFRLSYGNYGIILRNDGSNFYFLLTDSGSAENGSWNSLRPFYFSLDTGQIGMGNGTKSSWWPGATNTYSLGTSALRWSKLYVGTADTYGSSTQPIYWNNGVPTALTFTANRLLWTNSTTAISVEGHYVSSTKMAINSTNAPSVTLYVNGDTTIAGTLLPSVTTTYDLGSDTYKWSKVYATTFNGNLAGTINLTETNPASGTTYYLPFSANSGTVLRYNNGVRYYTLAGTTNTVGSSTIILGNNIASGTAANKTGVLQLYSDSAYYYQISGNKTLTANKTYFLPTGADSSTTLVVSTTATAVGSTTQPVFVNANNQIKATTYSLSATINAGSAANRLAYYSSTTGINSYNSTVGSTATPIYLNKGVPTAITYYSGNAASATKLLTVRTIWGQSFNGTADISGPISDVNNITPAAHNSYTIGTATSHWRAGYFNTLYVGSYTDYVSYSSTVPGTYISTGEIQLDTTSSGVGGYRIQIDNNDYFRVYPYTKGTAGTEEITTTDDDGNTVVTTAATQGTLGETYLSIGNSIARGEAGNTSGANNSRGTIRIYGTESSATYLRSDIKLGTSYMFLPNYNGTGYLTYITASAGNTSTPVYVTDNGRIKALTSTVGSSTKPIYMDSGTIKEGAYTLKATVNSGTVDTVAYYSGANAISSYTTTVGSTSVPIYFKAGVPTAISDYSGILKKIFANLNSYTTAAFDTGSWITSSVSGYKITDLSFTDTRLNSDTGNLALFLAKDPSDSTAAELSLLVDGGLYAQRIGLASTAGKIGKSYANIYLDGDNGTIKATGVYESTTTGSANVNVSSSGLIRRYSSSSIRYKNIYKNLTSEDIQKLYSIPTYWFKYKDSYLDIEDERFDKLIPGFIVEDWDSVMPIAIDHNKDGSPEMWNTGILIPIMFEMLKDLKEENYLLKQQIDKIIK